MRALSLCIRALRDPPAPKPSPGSSSDPCTSVRLIHDDICHFFLRSHSAVAATCFTALPPSSNLARPCRNHHSWCYPPVYHLAPPPTLAPLSPTGSTSEGCELVSHPPPSPSSSASNKRRSWFSPSNRNLRSAPHTLLLFCPSRRTARGVCTVPAPFPPPPSPQFSSALVVYGPWWFSIPKGV